MQQKFSTAKQLDTLSRDRCIRSCLISKALFYIIILRCFYVLNLMKRFGEARGGNLLLQTETTCSNHTWPVGCGCVCVGGGGGGGGGGGTNCTEPSAA